MPVAALPTPSRTCCRRRRDCAEAFALIAPERPFHPFARVIIRHTDIGGGAMILHHEIEQFLALLPAFAASACQIHDALGKSAPVEISARREAGRLCVREAGHDTLRK